MIRLFTEIVQKWSWSAGAVKRRLLIKAGRTVLISQV